MPLSELLPTVDQLSHQDKLRLIHHLLLQVAQEDGCPIDIVAPIAPSITSLIADASKPDLLDQLSSTEATVWSPQTSTADVQALSDLLASHHGLSNA